MEKSKAPRAAAATTFVRENPGCTKLAAAEAVGPNGSRRYGYQIVDRAIGYGWIEAIKRPNGSYQLYPAY